MSMWEEVAKATSKHGFNPIVGDIQRKQQLWYNWYRGDVNGFHLFKQKVNGKVKSFERETLNMPKKIAEDYTSLIWNDMCGIKYGSDATKKIVDKVLKRNNFASEYGWLLELSMAIGMGYTVEFLANLETKIDFIPFQNALPLGFDNGEVNALVTINPIIIFEKGKAVYITHLTYHYLENGKYIVMHEAYVSGNKGSIGSVNNRALNKVFSEQELNTMKTIIKDGDKSYLSYRMMFDTGRAFFQVHRPNIRNHFDVDSPYGVSVYATMLSYFKVVDVLFDMIMTETVDNRTRIVVDHQALQTTLVEDDAGNSTYINIFDEQDTVFQGVPVMNKDTGQKMIEFLQGALRLDQIDLALNKVLRLIGFRAGLGKQYYSFDDGAVYQNEKNVIFSNADTFKSKKKHEMTIGKALEDMIRSILHLEKMAGRYKGDPETEVIEIMFDDSIVQDDEQIKGEFMMLADKGYIPRWYALSKVLKISDEQAKLMVAEADSEDITAQIAGIEAVDEPTPEE